jgi:hypothetical protein
MPLAHEATFAGRGHRKSLHQTEAKVRRLDGNMDQYSRVGSALCMARAKTPSHKPMEHAQAAVRRCFRRKPAIADWRPNPTRKVRFLVQFWKPHANVLDNDKNGTVMDFR